MLLSIYLNPPSNSLKKEKHHVLLWPSKNTALNPMENLRGVLSREVYVNNKKFLIVRELEVVIVKY